MPIPDILSKEEIHERMEDIPLWDYKELCLVRELVASNFAAAMGVANAIAVLSEKLDHHPDILIYGWNKIRITLITHSINALSDLDFILAKQIDELNF